MSEPRQPLPLILASASPRRSELLKQLTSHFIVVVSNSDETEPPHLSPAEMCQANAHRKARCIAKEYPHHTILAADTLVFLNSKVYGKPSSLDEAARMLQELQGCVHSVITGVCILRPPPHPPEIFAEVTSVHFKTLTKDAIAHYHQRVNPLDKAGAYGIQKHGDQIIEGIEGSYSNVMGLPMERLRTSLAAWS